MSRLPELTRDQLNTAARGLRGPFNALLHAPHVGDATQRLGEHLRFNGILSSRQREIGVLCVAAYWRADYEWWAHARIARECGISDAIIEAIRRRARPELDDPAERLVHDYSRALLDERTVSEALYRDSVMALGEAALVELVVLLGYYSLVSMVLVSFEIPAPDGESPPFGD